MAHWNDWDYGEPENVHSIVERHMARLAPQLQPRGTAAAESESDSRKHIVASAAMDERDGFAIPTGCALAISPVLAAQLGYVEPPVIPPATAR
jgi:hypothetical protein